MAGAAPTILFAPAAGAQIGGGHLMRDLALAERLQARGFSCVFALPPWGADRLAHFADTPPEVAPLPRSGDLAALAQVIAAVRPRVLVLDDYSLRAVEVAPLRRPGLRIAVIDDLGDRPYACDLLVDPGHGRRPQDYAALTPPGCEVLTGPAYALLRPGFQQGAAGAPSIDGPVARVFVSFGLSDVGAIAARALELLRPLAPRARFDIALGSDAPSLPRLQALAETDWGLVVHPDARDVAGLMRQADVAVGAGGSGTWERCALGLPTLAVVVADNQRALLQRLSAEGVLLACDTVSANFEAELAAGCQSLLEPGVRRRLRAASTALCDGYGAERVADAIVSLVGPAD